MPDPDQIPIPAGVSPETWASMTPQAQLGLSQQLFASGGPGIPQFGGPPAPMPPPPPPPAQTMGFPNASFGPVTAPPAAPPIPGPPAAPSAPEAALPPTPYREAPGSGTGDITNKTAQTPGIAAHDQALVNPETQETIAQGFRDLQSSLGPRGQAGAQQALGAAEAGQQQALAQGAQGEAAAAGGAASEFGGIAKTARQRAEDHMAAADKFADEIKSDKIDPNHMWSSASAGTAARWTMAGILGGIAAGPGGTNQAVQHLEKMADQDIAAQKANFDARRDTGASMYARAFRETGNADDALKLAKTYAMTAAAHTTAALGAASGSAVKQAQANTVGAQLLTKVREVGIQGEQERQKDNRWVPTQAGGTVDIIHDPRVQAAALAMDKEAAAGGRSVDPNASLKRAAEIYFPGSQSGSFADISKAPKGGDAKTAEKGAALDSALDNARKLQEAIMKGGELSPARTRELNNLAGELAISMRSAAPGRPAPLEHYQSLVPSNPNGWDVSGANAAQINQLVQHLEAEKARGVTGGGAADVGFTPIEGEP